MVAEHKDKDERLLDVAAEMLADILFQTIIDKHINKNDNETTILQDK